MTEEECLRDSGDAFQYAGARSVLMSLWSVALDSTTMLGEEFFSNIKDGLDKDDALLAARPSGRVPSRTHRQV